MTERPWIAPFETRPEHAVPAEEPPPALPERIEPPSPEPTTRRLGWRLLLVGGGLFLAGALLAGAVEVVLALAERHVVLGGIFAGLLALAVAGAGLVVWSDLRDLRRLRIVETYRHEAERLYAEDGYGRAMPLLARMHAEEADDPSYARFLSVVGDAHGDRDVLRLYADHVLAPLDGRARRLILAAARDTALLTAISPLALIDTLGVLVRNLRLIRDVASVYGFRPGRLGRIRLVRAVIRNLAVAGVAEGLSDMTVEGIGGSLAAALSARAGQGAANGLLTARLGLVTAEQCRPLPLIEGERAGFKGLRRELLSLLRRERGDAAPSGS